jgi:diguanylate cyclase (GGDEF)-like protein
VRRDSRRTRPCRRQPWSTWAFTFLLVAMAGVGGPITVDRLRLHGAPWELPWPMLAAGFAAGHIGAIRFEFSGELQEVNLSEIPLLIGLVLVQPHWLLVATAVGTALAVVWSRDAPIKALFNVAVRSLETVVAVVCFHAVLGHTSALDAGPAIRPAVAGAALVAVLAANLVSTLCVQVIIALSVGRVDSPRLLSLAVVLPVIATLNLFAGIIGAELLLISWFAAALFVVIAVALGLSYRAYGQLQRRHRDLGEMYRFSQALAALDKADEVIGAVLVEARTLFQGRLAEFAFETPDGTARYSLEGDSPMAYRLETSPHPLQMAVSTAGRGTVAKRNSNDKQLSDALVDSGVWNAVIAPLPVFHGIIGSLIVADRLGDPIDFGSADRDLLELLADKAASALRAVQILGWLREEVTAKNHMAFHDMLTDLPNRALFNDEVERALTRRREPCLVGVMIMDLDRFKLVNDTFGHHSGDLVLQQVAAQLTQAVAGRGTVGRLGGDEFAVVAVARDRAEMDALVTEVSAAGRAAIVLDETRLTVESSLGVAIAPDHGEDRSSLLRAADTAMYQAKADQRDVAYHQPSRRTVSAHPIVDGNR